MTTIGPDGKISSAGPPNQAPGLAPVTTQGQAHSSVSASTGKKLTHFLAAALAAIAAFALTPAGQALIAQYPHLAVVGGLLSTLSALYRDPNAA